VRHGDDLVFSSTLKFFLKLGESYSASDRSLELFDFRSVGLQALGKAVAKVSGMEDESVLALLDEVGCNLKTFMSLRVKTMNGLRNLIPTEGTTSADEERLRRLR
jgi:hypothetical protein